MMASAQRPSASSEYSPLFTQGLYSANASRRHLESASFLDVDSPSESGDDADVASFVGVLRPRNGSSSTGNSSGRTVSPTPTVRPGPSSSAHPYQARPSRYIPPPAPAPSSALPALPSPQYIPYQAPPPSRPPPAAPYSTGGGGGGAMAYGHARTPTHASFASTASTSTLQSPTDARGAALARLEGRPAQNQNGNGSGNGLQQMNGRGEQHRPRDQRSQREQQQQQTSFLSLDNNPPSRSRALHPRA